MLEMSMWIYEKLCVCVCVCVKRQDTISNKILGAEDKFKYFLFFVFI